MTPIKPPYTLTEPNRVLSDLWSVEASHEGKPHTLAMFPVWQLPEEVVLQHAKLFIEALEASQKPSSEASVILAEGYHRLKAENERLKEWIRQEGVRTDTCTYDVLKEMCEGCRCKRFYKQQGYGK